MGHDSIDPTDDTGSPGATTRGRISPPRRTGFRVAHLLVLGGLLVVPGWAIGRLSSTIDLQYLLATAAGLSLLSFTLHCWDKKRAEAHRWRISESTLHAFELFGGWPGAFLAQRLFRHKTAKWTYRITFWIIVLAHQWVAVDYVLDWPMSRALLQRVRPVRAEAHAPAQLDSGPKSVVAPGHWTLVATADPGTGCHQLPPPNGCTHAFHPLRLLISSCWPRQRPNGRSTSSAPTLQWS